MEKINLNNYRSLYLGPINFNDLALLGDLNFKITLLVTFPIDSCKAHFIDDVNQSPEFAHLSRLATINEIVDVMRKHKLVMYEFILERQEIRIQSVIGNDLFLEVLGDNHNVRKVIDSVMQSWELPKVKFSEHDIDLIEPNKLLEISTKDGTPHVVRDIKGKDDLINFLVDERQELIWSKDPFVRQHRIYYTQATSREQN